jgi:signal peptidase I
MQNQRRSLAVQLGRASLAAGEPLRLEVISPSMSPLIAVGDAVIVQPVVLDDLRCGDVIVVQRGAEWVTHRLVAVNANGFHTKGDRGSQVDPPAAGQDVIGLVAAVERRGRRVDLRTARRQALGRLIAWLGWREARILPGGWRFPWRAAIRLSSWLAR